MHREIETPRMTPSQNPVTIYASFYQAHLQKPQSMRLPWLTPPPNPKRHIKKKKSSLFNFSQNKS